MTPAVVLDCNIKRLTAEETGKYLRQNGFRIDVTTVKRYRAKIMDSAQYWIAKLAKSKRGDYLAEPRDRIEEFYGLQKRLWETMKKQPTQSDRSNWKIVGLFQGAGGTIRLFANRERSSGTSPVQAGSRLAASPRVVHLRFYPDKYEQAC